MMSEQKANVEAGNILIGWAAADVTPDQPVLIAGQFHARVSEGVMDPVTANVLVIEHAGEERSESRAVMVSCDFVTIPNGLRDAVRSAVRRVLPQLDPTDIMLNATHTHAGPEVRVESDTQHFGGGNVPAWVGVDLPVMSTDDYVAFASERIAEAVQRAWEAREPGGISFGLGHAVVGHNRRVSYYDGSSRMYGNTDDPEFSHIEGYEDHNVNVLSTWNKDRRLTGLAVNVACPSQVSGGSYEISADYWHETRQELRQRLSPDLFVLPQCSAAGDQTPSILVGKDAEERMWRLLGRTQRQDIGVRIADAVATVLPAMEKDIEWNPVFTHRVETVDLPARLMTEKDVKVALSQAAEARKTYESLQRNLNEHPEKRQQPRWYKDITSAYRRMRWNESVVERFRRQETQTSIPIEVHVLRLGAVAFATNPFEYYVDYGVQIKARSKAVQTFLVQHTGSGTYLPTIRAVSGGSYGAVPASTPVGPEGGRELARRTVDIIAALWQES